MEYAISRVMNMPQADIKNTSYLHEFDKQVIQSQTANAVTNKNITYSYHELAMQSKLIALALKSYDVNAGTKIAVGIPRNEMLIPLLLAIWSLRATYVPVDPAFPVSRQSYILENSEAKIAIFDQKNLIEVKNCIIINFNDLTKLASTMIIPGDISLANNDTDSDDIAYIIYTSGSTGNPKGVAISQSNLINFIQSMVIEPGIDYHDSLLAITTISFDIHILEIFLPLFVGAHVILATREESISQDAMRELINKRNITIMQATPATWRLILENGWNPEHKLKILIGGESFPIDLKNSLLNIANQVWNMYGPTETTVWSTCYNVERNKPVYIGKPIQNTQVYIVNNDLETVPFGTPGELLIGGKGVAIGYYNNSRLTSERFIKFGSTERVYRTGDLVKQCPDGNIEYINRIDNQLKIRGYRIEPSEVELVLSKSPLVKQSAVVASEIQPNDVRLIAFYIGENDINATLRDLCNQNLPWYMVPQYYICLDKFPMTDNFKIDRKMLSKEGVARFSETNKICYIDARDDLDRSLMYVWGSLLGVNEISIEDNFFELGGHSLLALQAINEMKKATGLDIPLSVFFETPTIKQIRFHLGKLERRASSVIKLNNTDRGDPIFCLCGVQIYDELAKHFQDIRPVYGIFASEEVSFLNAEVNSKKIDYSLDLLVETYKNALMRQGNPKAVTLVGLSFGGLMCLEVAKKLISEGINVHNVYLLDSYTAISAHRSFHGLLEDTVRYFFTDSPITVIKHFIKMFQKLFIIKNTKTTKNNISHIFNQNDRDKAFERASRIFMNSNHTFTFDCVLIKAVDTNFGFGFRPYHDYKLKEYIKGKLHIHNIKAEHIKILEKECAAIIYEIIQQHEPDRVLIND